MRYLLDTNTCIRFLNGRSPGIRQRFLVVRDEDIALSSVVKAEMLAGAKKSRFPEANVLQQQTFFRRFRSLPFDDEAALAYGQLRAHLEQQGTPIGANEMLIAATALTHQLILVSHNTREFERVPGLQLEDWEV
jgi:tRNA(fMet)-specific endonuclease VapC